MPIRSDLKPLYGSDWPDLSHRIRFVRAAGRCERCDRPHGRLVYTLPDGSWLDPGVSDGWRNDLGEPIGLPSRAELLSLQLTRVVLTTAHIDHDPTHGDDMNLAGWCSRCHILHDMPHHRAQRRLTLRARWAIGDLFEGRYSLVGYPRNT
jgi:hypothetical protein